LIGKDNKDLKRLNRIVLVIHLIKYVKRSAASLTDSIEKELRNDNIKYTKKTLVILKIESTICKTKASYVGKLAIFGERCIGWAVKNNIVIRTSF